MALRRTPDADGDLDAIWDHIAADNMDAASRLIVRIEAAEQRLATFPNLGRARVELAPDLRSWAVGDYVIFYRAHGADVLILRILHGARDLPDLLGGP